MSTTTTPRNQGQQGNDKSRQAGEHAQQAGEKLKEGASTAMDKVKDAASHAGEAVSAAAAVGRKADDAAGSVGSGIQSLADSVRDKGPSSGMLGKATETVAGALEHTGKYLEDKQLSGMAEDVTGLIKKNPIPALLIGVGVGFLLGRMLKG